MKTTLLSVAFLVLGAAGALAGPVEDCNQVRDPQRQLAGCSAYIKLGKANPQNLATAHLNRANIYASRRDYRRAFIDYAIAIDLDPSNPLAFYNRGNALFDLKRYDEAIADYDATIELDSEFALAFYNRGLAWERKGQHVRAAEDFRHVLSLNPTFERAKKSLERLPVR